MESPRVAVITPYHREDEAILRCCHESVAGQSHPCTHIMVADGHPSPAVAAWQVEHMVLPQAHGDNGNTPRGIASLCAMRQGFDAIAYLDADNWFEAEHIAAMVALQRKSQAAVCTAGRMLHDWEGGALYRDDAGNDGKDLVDTSCLYLTRAAFGLLPLWCLMPPQVSPICDRVIWRAVQMRGLTTAHDPTATVGFRTRYARHYELAGREVPAWAKSGEEAMGCFQWLDSLPETERQRWGTCMRTGAWSGPIGDSDSIADPDPT